MLEKQKTVKKQFTEISNLPDKEFKAIVIRKLIEFWKRIDKHSENFNRELENIKMN